MSKALNPDELDLAINTIQWRLDQLKAISATKILFEAPARVPPLSVIEQLNPLDIARMNEQQILYSYTVSLSTSVGLKQSISTVDSLLTVNTSTLTGIDTEQRKADAAEQIMIANQTASYNRMIQYQQNSAAAERALGQLRTASTQLASFSSRNQQFLTSTINAIYLYDTFLSREQAKGFIENYEYIAASLAVSTAKSQYEAFSTNVYTVSAKIPSLEQAVQQQTAAYITASNAKIAKQGIYESTLSSIDGFATLSTMSSYEVDTLLSKKKEAEARRDQETLYYQLATFYQSSNSLRIQKEEYERNLATASGYIQQPQSGGGSVARVAYKMARDVYKQIGGQLTTVVDQYNSTVTGIAAFEEAMFGKVKQASDEQIATLEAEVETHRARKVAAATASATYAQEIERLRADRQLYETSSLAIAALYSNAQTQFRTAEASIPTLEVTFNATKEETDAASSLLQNYKTQVASIQEEIQRYQNTSTIAGREVEVLTERIPAIQVELDEATDRYIEVESGAAEIKGTLEEAMRSQKIETRYKQHADSIVIRTNRISTLNDVFRKVAEERVKETDLRAARTALSELLAERREQLQKISESIPGSKGPDLTDETYVALTERMNGLSKVLDEDYDSFYGTFTEYEYRFPLYEEIVSNVEMAQEALIQLQNRLDNGETDATMAMGVATAEKQVEKYVNEESMARQGLQHIVEQIDAYIAVFEKNRDLFVPAETQAATEAAIRAAAAAAAVSSGPV
jgi:hypothetical protein